jgi:hypothetical protein
LEKALFSTASDLRVAGECRPPGHQIVEGAEKMGKKRWKGGGAAVYRSCGRGWTNTEINSNAELGERQYMLICSDMLRTLISSDEILFQCSPRLSRFDLVFIDFKERIIRTCGLFGFTRSSQLKVRFLLGDCEDVVSTVLGSQYTCSATAALRTADSTLIRSILSCS